MTDPTRVEAALDQCVAAANVILATDEMRKPLVQLPLKEWTELVGAIRGW